MALAGEILIPYVFIGLSGLPRWHKADGPMSAQEVGRQYVDFVLNGLKVERD